MKCSEIKPGMLLTSKDDLNVKVVKGQRFRIVKPGKSFRDEKGVKIELDNSRRNKWWVKDLSAPPDSKLILLCFPETFGDDYPFEFSAEMR